MHPFRTHMHVKGKVCECIIWAFCIGLKPHRILPTRQFLPNHVTSFGGKMEILRTFISYYAHLFIIVRRALVAMFHSWAIQSGCRIHPSAWSGHVRCSNNSSVMRSDILNFLNWLQENFYTFYFTKNKSLFFGVQKSENDFFFNQCQIQTKPEYEIREQVKNETGRLYLLYLLEHNLDIFSLLLFVTYPYKIYINPYFIKFDLTYFI